MLEKIVLGRFEEVRNGVPLKYRIETASVEFEEQIIDHMVKYFLKRELLTTYDRLIQDKKSLNSFISVWRGTLQEGTAMVALEDRDDDVINIVGVNLTLVLERDKKDDKVYEGEAFNKLLKVVDVITTEGNIYERYDVDKHLSAFGLSVHPDYHGYKIGYRLLSCREPLCKILGLKATGTIFSAKAAEHIAAKAGFEVIIEVSYDSFKIDGKLAYPGIRGTMSYMGRKYSFE